jgi:transposase
VSEEKSKELRVSVDVGYRRHSVAIGLPSGEVLEEFEIEHRLEGFQDFFSRIEKHNHKQDHCVAVAMEGYNGYARPLDSMVRQHGYRLYNINNLKLARFKEIFPGSAKSDRIDARKGLELFQLRDHLPLAKEVLQEVSGTPKHNEVLKRLTRRRRRLVNERVRVVNNLQADLQAVCPGLLEITSEASSQWFLNFLLSAPTLPQLARLRKATLLKIPAVGRKYASRIEDWQKRAHFGVEVEWVSEMIQEDAQRCLDLAEMIKTLQTKIKQVAKDSKIATIIIHSRFWAGVHLRVSGRDRDYRAVREGRKLGSVPGHVHVGQQLGEVSRIQDAEARQHQSQSSNDDRLGSSSKICARVAEVLREETRRGKEAQPGHPCSRSTSVPDHLQDAQRGARVRDSA